MTETETRAGWLSREELRDARERLPIIYVEAVPVRVDDRGVVTQIGLLLRASAEGTVDRELVSGRVLYHERIRDALLRHIEKDLGPLAMPRIPVSPQPFTVAEYFPTPGSRRSTTHASTLWPWRSSWRCSGTARRSRMRSTSPGSPPTKRPLSPPSVT